MVPQCLNMSYEMSHKIARMLAQIIRLKRLANYISLIRSDSITDRQTEISSLVNSAGSSIKEAKEPRVPLPPTAFCLYAHFTLACKQAERIFLNGPVF